LKWEDGLIICLLNEMYEFIVINADGKVPTAYGSRGSTSSASFGYASRRARNIY